MKKPKKPVIFLCFANEYHKDRYLENLVTEHKNLLEILSPISVNEQGEDDPDVICEYVIRQNVTLDDIINVFQNKNYQGRINIFHYAGHADGYQLLLQGKSGSSEAAYGEGLVSILGKQESLKLIFLNGCSTQKLAQDLVARGVPGVIGTSASIADDVALTLSRRFYGGLAQGLTIGGAWETAQDQIKTRVKGSNFRGLYFEEAEVTDRFPWDFEYRDDAAKELVNQWNLPKEANNPLFNLPSIDGTSQLPPSPFLFLQPYTREHAEIFFGRSYYIRDLYRKISEPGSPPLILLYGESGAGKSSLLDAGLLPRLRAAKDPDSGELIFESRYERRDADDGLVGSLSRMLADALGDTGETAVQTVAQEEDPNTERIDQISSVIEEMDGDAKEFFSSLIQRYRAVHQSRLEGGRDEQSHYEKGELKAHTGAQLREMWKAVEKKTGKRLILILDQVEEAFTRPHPDMKNELEDLLNILREIFAAPETDEEQQIRGKMILGYREEFNARIEARIKDLGLPRSSVFLEHLKEEDILDIFRGLQTKVVQQHYGIELDEKLPSRISNDVLNSGAGVSNSQTPVAPILQLILTKLWYKCHEDNPAKPQFTVEAYEEIHGDGKEMETFFQEQMAKVFAWKPEVVNTGLALDVLHFHVTDLGTSGRRHIEEIRSVYRHLPDKYEDQPDLIDELVNKLKDPEILLLTDNGRGFTSLPHDTLAPIVMREWNYSDKLGQRSSRIIDTKGPEFKKAVAEEKERIRLDDNDVDVVEQGMWGMRALSDPEQRLLELSRIEREKRLKLRRKLVQGGLVAAGIISLLVFVSSLLSIRMVGQLQEAAISRALEESLELKSKDDSISLGWRKGLLSYAYENDEHKRSDVIEDLFHLAHDGVVNEGIAGPVGWQEPFAYPINQGTELTSLDYEPEVGVVAGFEDGFARFYPSDDSKMQPKFERKNKGSQIGFTADGYTLQLLSVPDTEQRQQVYNMDGDLVPAPYLDLYIFQPDVEFLSYYTEDPVVSDYLESFFNGDSLMYIGYYDFFSGIFVDHRGEKIRSAKSLSKKYERFVITLENYSLIQLGSQPETYVQSEYGLFEMRVWDRKRDEVSQAAVGALSDYMGSIMGDEGKEFIADWTLGWFDGVESRSCKSTVFEFSNLHEYQILDLQGNLLKENTLIGGYFYVNALDDQRLLTVELADYANAVIVTRIRVAGSHEILAELDNEGTILDLDLCNDGEHIVTYTDTSAYVWDYAGTLLQKLDIGPGLKYQTHPTGSGVLAYNASHLEIWKPGMQGQAIQYFAPPTHKISSVRFIPDDDSHVAIGLQAIVPLDTTEEEYHYQDSLICWNILDHRMDKRFALEIDFAVDDLRMSRNGKHAVVLGHQRPDNSFGANPGPYQMRFLGESKLRLGEGNQLMARKRELLAFSPGGKYVIRYSNVSNVAEILSLEGKTVGSFELKKGMQPGFSSLGMTTPDDHYMIAHNSEEAILWTIDPGQLRMIGEWTQAKALDYSQKEEYGLNAFLDHIAGKDATSQLLGLGLLLLSIAFMLIYATKLLYGMALEKNYWALGLNGFVTFLLGALLLLFWSLKEAGDTRSALIFFAVIFALIAASQQAWPLIRARNWKDAATPLVVIALLISGTTIFTIREDAGGDLWLWDNIISTLISTVAIGLFLVFPIYKALKSRRNDSARGFFSWLLPIGAMMSLGFWLTIEAVFEDSGIPVVDFTLLVGSLALGAWSLRSQTRTYRREGKTLGLALLWITGLLLLLLLPSSNQYGVQLAANITLLGPLLGLYLGFVEVRNRALKPGFYKLHAGIALVIGLWVAMLASSGYDRLFPAVNITAYFASLFLSILAAWRLRVAIQKYYAGKEEGRSVFRPVLAISVIILILLATVLSREDWADTDDFALYTDQQIDVDEYGTDATYASDDYYYDDDYYYEDDEGTYPEEDVVTAPNPAAPVSTADSLAPGLEPPSLDSTVLDTVLTESRQLILGMFDADQEYRDDSRNRLVSGYLEDPGLVPDLITASYANPDEHNGILNALYILELLSDEQLNAYNREMTEYLLWMEMRGYGPETTERIANLKTRIIPVPEGEDFDLADLPRYQQLIVLMFDPDANTRDAARDELLQNHRAETELILDLIAYSYEDFDMDEGIWNTLYVLEQLDDAQLQEYVEEISGYLDLISQKNYGPATMERVVGIRDRL